MNAKYTAILHYCRMIKCVEENADKNNFIWTRGYYAAEKMKALIQENWYGTYCSYCNINDEECSTCSLCGAETEKDFESDDLSEFCCEGLWIQMERANSWDEWLEGARKVRRYIILHGRVDG